MQHIFLKKKKKSFSFKSVSVICLCHPPPPPPLPAPSPPHIPRCIYCSSIHLFKLGKDIHLSFGVIRIGPNGNRVHLYFRQEEESMICYSFPGITAPIVVWRLRLDTLVFVSLASIFPMSKQLPDASCSSLSSLYCSGASHPGPLWPPDFWPPMCWPPDRWPPDCWPPDFWPPKC